MHVPRIAIAKFMAPSHQRDIAINPNGSLVEAHRFGDTGSRDCFQHFGFGLIQGRRMTVGEVGMVDLIKRGNVFLHRRLGHCVQRGHHGFFILGIVRGRKENEGRRHENPTEQNYELAFHGEYRI